MLFKIEIQDEKGNWSDVRGADGAVLTFESADDARAKLAKLYPVMVQMENYGGGKRTRVIRIFRNDKEWKEGTP